MGGPTLDRSNSLKLVRMVNLELFDTLIVGGETVATAVGSSFLFVVFVLSRTTLRSIHHSPSSPIPIAEISDLKAEVFLLSPFKFRNCR
jgi:hypothetical protein